MSDTQLIQEMLDLQNQFNQNLSPTWKSDDYPYHRATWLEAAELIESLNWKWWKHQNNDWDNVTVELVDIWHFVMSQALIKEMTADTFTQYIGTHAPDQNENTLIPLAEQLAKAALDRNIEIQIRTFFECWNTIGHSLETLFKLYVGKNALNHFRQLNGYKHGTYIKIWNGEEDNIHMLNIMEDIDLTHNNIYSEVIKALTTRYASLQIP